ncbi:GH32 C-terminal domain-containing protein [Paenibacillus sp. CC-CFT747]|nr:GH32 C-terminal domain-containing protein [Paenibacillus sp. CC-CFT747]
MDFHPAFACRHEAPLSVEEGRLRLHLFLDTSSVEVFANDGELVLTDLIFPHPDSRSLILFAEGEGAVVERLEVNALGSIYDPGSEAAKGDTARRQEAIR